MHDWEKVDKKIGCIQSSLRYYKKITTVTVIRWKKRLEKSLENDSKFLLKSLKILSNIVNQDGALENEQGSLIPFTLASYGLSNFTSQCT